MLLVQLISIGQNILGKLRVLKCCDVAAYRAHTLSMQVSLIEFDKFCTENIFQRGVFAHTNLCTALSDRTNACTKIQHT